MENFTYANEFESVADVARIGNADDVQIHYAVFVGDPNLEFSFLDSEQFIHEENFTTYGDAEKALALTKRTLELVDQNLAQGLKLSDVRDEILAAVDKAIDKATNTYYDLRHAKQDSATTKYEVAQAINHIFNYYISNGE